MHNKTLQGCSQQIALEGQDLPRTYLAHHELESVTIIIIIIIIIIIVIVIVIMHSWREAV